MTEEKSCGAVVFTREGGVIKYVIVRNIAGRCHGFPKGHVEGDETEAQTALREIKEETSLDVSFTDGFRIVDTYPIKNGSVMKTVVYFLCEYEDQTPKAQEDEIASVKILPYEEALALLEYESAKEVLRRANEFINKERSKTVNERIVIKEMESDDEIKGKAYVHYKSWHEAYKGIVSDEYLDKMTVEKCEELSYKWRDRVITAKDNGRVVGFVGYGESSELQGYGEIFALYVLSEYYGTGVGQMLFDAASEKLAEYPHKCLWVLKENKRARRFYEKNGFYPDGAEKFSPMIAAFGIRMING